MHASHAVPCDVWRVIHEVGGLTARDVASLAMTCRDWRAKMNAMRLEDGVRAHHAVPGIDVTTLAIVATAMRFPARRPYHPLDPHAFGALRSLRTLTVRFARLGANPFWPVVFSCCPHLRRVAVDGESTYATYANELRHACDLVRVGAPRLHALEVVGDWLVINPDVWNGRQEPPDVLRAIAAMRATPAPSSTTLRRFKMHSRQAPLGVDAPLDVLDVCEPPAPPFALARMGRATYEACRRLTWHAHWPHFDAVHVAPFVRLRTVELHLGSTPFPDRLSACLATLRHLPSGIDALSLHLDLALMRSYDSAVRWGTPLRGKGVRRLDIVAASAPSSLHVLMRDWLGVGCDGVARHVEARFREHPATSHLDDLARLRADENACSDDEVVMELREDIARLSRPCDGAGLSAWLDANPGAAAVVSGVDVTCDHPRFTAAW